MSSVSIFPQTVTAQISSYQPDTVFGLCSTMHLGRKNESSIYRILFKFPVSIIPNQCFILKAILKIYIRYAGLLTPIAFTPYALSQDWSFQTVTWNNQPAYYPTVAGETKLIQKGDFHTFNITRMITKWYENEIMNYGLIIKSEELQDQSYMQINTDLNSDLSPVIEIAYTQKSKINIVSSRYISGNEEIDTAGSYSFSSIVDISLTKTITCHIKNLGSTPVEVKYQTSPNGIDFIDDCSNPRILPGHEMIWLVPYSFAKYGRIAARNIDPTETSRIKIWYEAQE